MSTLSDVQALYGSARDTWAKSQAHIIAHVVLAIVLFVICRATFPEVTIPRLDAKQITENEWFKLAKDTGLVYASFVIPVIAVALYAAVLRIAGQVLVAILMLIFPPSPRKYRFRLLNSPTLVPLALTLKKKDFSIGDLLNKSTEFVLKYQAKKSEAWEAYQKSIGVIAKNAQVYLGDFLVFVLTWIMLFRLIPQAAWIQANQTRFWPVVIVLSCLVWFAWFRVSRALTAVPSLLLMFVSATLLTDPDMAHLLDVDDKVRHEVRLKLDELLRKEQEGADNRPSLRRLLAYRLGLSKAASKDMDLKQRRGLPFRSVYERGFRFSWEKERHLDYYAGWFVDYLAYLYYRLHNRVYNLMRAIWQLARYFVTGAP